jgi:glucose/arabinose dehydrogenase
MNTYNKILSALTLSLACCASANAIEKYIPDGYTIETIETPKDVRFHVTGMDSTEKGEIYVVTRLGEVWRLYQNKWTKFADGLHEPTGLSYEPDGSILVAQKPELTRLVDVDKDGIADEYIQLASDWDFHDNYHEFNFGPVKNKNGDYIGTLNLSHGAPKEFSLGTMGSKGGYRGWAYKVTPEGEFSPFAYGLRSPAGIGASPSGEVFITDNQGDWVETSKLHLLEEDKFYGHPIPLIDHPDFTRERILRMSDDELNSMREKPVAWIPHVEVANSPGNPEWDTTKGKFGPFKGQIFISDQTQSNIFRVILDKVNGKYQGAVINFIGGFQSGNIRVNFDNNGQLWVGQTARGWGSQGGKPFGLEKVVWDGTNPFELLDMKLTKAGFTLNFTEALDSTSVIEKHLKATEWNYLYSRAYGSAKHNEKSLPIKKIKLSSDKKTVNVELDLTADKIVMLEFAGLTSKTDRKPAVTKVYYTLNSLIN